MPGWDNVIFSVSNMGQNKDISRQRSSMTSPLFYTKTPQGHFIDL